MSSEVVSNFELLLANLGMMAKAHGKIADALKSEEDKFNAEIRSMKDTHGKPDLARLAWKEITKTFRRLAWKEFAILSLQAKYKETLCKFEALPNRNPQREFRFCEAIMVHTKEGILGPIPYAKRRQVRRGLLLTVGRSMERFVKEVLPTGKMMLALIQPETEEVREQLDGIAKHVAEFELFNKELSVVIKAYGGN